MATRIEFCVRAFCGVDAIPSNENSLLQTTFTHFRFLARDRLAKLGNPFTL